MLPSQRFMTLFHPDQKMFYAGSEEPAAFLEVASIGFIGGDKNVTISAALTETIGKHLSVPADRVYINVRLIPYHVLLPCRHRLSRL